MWWAARVRPGSAAMIMTLGADINVRVVLVRKVVRGGQKEIVGRGQRLAELVRVNEAGHDIRPDVVLVRFMTSGTRDTDGACSVRSGQGLTLQQRFPDGSGVATSATRDRARTADKVRL